MRSALKKPVFVLLFTISLTVLAGCSSFNGIRTPLYDGQPVESKEEAIETYRKTGEVAGAEKEYYIRYPFSEDIYAPSLAYPEAEPVLLREGSYTIGEDLPAGRATLLGNESVFSPESYEAHVGNMIIRDEAGEVYFENLFHSLYGQSTVQVDLREGHEINIVGTDAEVTVFYAEELPEDPYILMDLPELLITMGRMETVQPIEQAEDGKTVSLTAGIYEVGVHLEPGMYEVTSVFAPHATEMYLFRTGEEPRVFELLLGQDVIFFDPEMLMAEDIEMPDFEIPEKSNIEIELLAGDKIYPNLVRQLQLTRVSGE